MGIDTLKLQLRGATKEQTELAISRSFAAFNLVSAKASSLRTFLHAAKSPTTQSHVESQMAGLCSFAIEEGIFKSEFAGTQTHTDLPPAMAAKTIQSAESGIKLARAVILHSAIEDFLLRLCRVGTALNRQQALKSTELQKISLRELRETDAESLNDRAIEGWLERLERESVLEKWDRLVGLVGHPTGFNRGIWHFDRKDLQAFDEARHDAVHASGGLLDNFDLDEFEIQVRRAVWCWLVQVCKPNGLQLVPHAMFAPASPGGDRSTPSATPGSVPSGA